MPAAHGCPSGLDPVTLHQLGGVDTLVLNTLGTLLHDDGTVDLVTACVHTGRYAEGQEAAVTFRQAAGHGSARLRASVDVQLDCGAWLRRQRRVIEARPHWWTPRRCSSAMAPPRSGSAQPQSCGPRACAATRLAILRHTAGRRLRRSHLIWQKPPSTSCAKAESKSGRNLGRPRKAAPGVRQRVARSACRIVAVTTSGRAIIAR